LCGIVGFTTRNWHPGPERISQATESLLHRGPDQQGLHRSPLCSLGATRLKIIDLAGGDQPICSEDRDTVIAFNGEIYNHLSLRKELEARGHRFRTHCDTETVLHAFLEWDTACFERLHGMFAVAIWCNSRKRLILARDRLGIKPLYIAEQKEEIFFASELKGILIHPEIERKLSFEGLDCYLSMNYSPSPWTLMDGIEKLPPGSWLEWKNGSVSRDVYWRVPDPAPEPMSIEDAAKELDGLIERSVREHMMSDVPLGVWLSGGLDSTTILHYAAQVSSSRLRTFSISFNGRTFDESPYISEAVRRYDTEHEQLDLNPEQDLEGAIHELTYYSDEPSADSGALPVWFLSRLCRQSVTVAFSGEGADEIFGGYLTYRANRIAALLRRLPSAAIRTAMRALNAWPASNEKISFEYKLKRLLQGTLLPPEEAHVYWNGSFSEAEKSSLLTEPLPGTFPELLSPLRTSLPGDGLGPFMHFDQTWYLADDILVKSDRMSMAHSIEVRPPFLDHRIVEFAAKIPSELKVSGKSQKRVLKELMKGKLSPLITGRSKIGFDIPTHEWFRGPLRGTLTDSLESAETEYGDLFRFDRIRTLIERHMRREINIGYHLWGLMILFLWMKKWRVTSVSVRQAGKHALVPGD
jgi:asparagine synthase (glutamine-hydrolysing)